MEKDNKMEKEKTPPKEGKKEKKSEENGEKELSAKEKVKELTELLQRTQANFENYRKQQEKRIEELHQFAHQELISQLLPLLDNFELALKNTHNHSDFLKGIELIYSQFFTILEKQGLKPIPTKNQSFDPHLHDALLKQPSPYPENTILEELQKGFTLNNRVIRHAKVKISSGAAPENIDKKKDKIQITKTRRSGLSAG